MIWAPVSLMVISKLPQKRLLVYAALLSFQGKNKTCRVGTEAMSERIFLEAGERITRNAIQKQISKLKKDGWLRVKRTGRTSVYTVIGPDSGNPEEYSNGTSDVPTIRLIRCATAKAHPHKRTS